MNIYGRVFLLTCMMLVCFNCSSQSDQPQETNQPSSSHQLQPSHDSKLTDDIRQLTDAGQYDEAVVRLEELLRQNPEDLQTKMALGEVYVQYADSYMWNEEMTPKQKYPAALKFYSKALEYNPHHKKALDGKNIILRIYRQMGRTPPEV